MSLFAKWLKFNTEKVRFSAKLRALKSSNMKKYSVAASVVWEALKRKRAQRESPNAASLSRLGCLSKIP